MTTPDAGTSSLADRVARLEGGARRTQAAVVVLAGLVVFVGFLLPLMRNEVAAETFVLRAGGETRALLTTTAGTGAPALSLFDADGAIRADLSLRADGSPGLVLIDERGRVRGMFRLTGEGVPNILFTDTEGLPKAAIGLPTDGIPALVLLGDSGRVRYMTP